MERLDLNDPRRGHLVLVDFMGWRDDAKPARITDHDSRVWVVESVVSRWEHPHRGSSGPDKLPFGAEAERWTLDVVGPLPYTPGRGPQVVAIRSFGDGAGWYMLPTS